MRNLSELYTIVKEGLPKEKRYFICICIYELLKQGDITEDETDRLFEDLNPRREEAGIIAPEGYYGGEGWWHTEVLGSRIKFLEHLIKLHKKLENKS